MILGGGHAPGWRYAYATSVGTSHLRNGTPCQDAADCRQVIGADGGPVLLAAASDGAGSATHSQEGSRFACYFFQHWFSERLRSHGAEDLGTDTVILWLSHLRHLLELKAERLGTTIRELACTFLGAIVGTDHSIFFQLGDGAIVIRSPVASEEFDWVFWPQSGEYANMTNFVVDRDASTNLQVTRFSGFRIDELALFTDGIQPLVLHYATRTAHTPFFDSMLDPVRTSKRPGLLKPLSGDLKHFLESKRVTERTDDDKTLLLASRQYPGLNPEAKPG